MLRCLLFLAALTQGGDPEEIFRKAVELQAAGRTEAAIEQYKAYLRLRPERVEAISNLGAALARAGRMQEAIEAYKLALKKDASNPAVRLNLALAYYKTAQIGTAIAELEKLNLDYPEHLRVAELLGDCYFRQGDWKKVIALLGPFEDKHPEERTIAYLLGIALLRDKQVQRGERVIDRLFRGGDSAEAHVLLGTAKFELNDFLGARDEFAKAVQLNPKLPSVYSLYANALRESGSHEEATKAYRQALAEDPNDFDANLYVGANLRQEQSYDEALAYLRKALQVRPDSPAAKYQLGATHLGAGKLEEARKELEALTKDWPTFVEAHVSLAMLYYRLNRRADGDRESELVRKLNAEIQARQPGERGSAQAGPPQAERPAPPAPKP